jgi:hypothetical protein
MANITVKMKDGTVKEFMHEGRAGGSWTKTVKCKDGFVIITDEWNKQTIIPACDVIEVIKEPFRY